MAKTSKTNKPFIILLEGTDKSGKTTLMETLAKKVPGLVMKLTARPFNSSAEEREGAKEYWDLMMLILEDNPDKTFILDRYYPSELVYSLPKRGYEAWEDNAFWELDHRLSNLDSLLVLCKPPLETIQERLGRMGDEHVVAEDMKVLYERYEKFYEATSLHKMTVDTREPVEQLVDQIVKKINEYQGNNVGEQLSLFGR